MGWLLIEQPHYALFLPAVNPFLTFSVDRLKFFRYHPPMITYLQQLEFAAGEAGLTLDEVCADQGIGRNLKLWRQGTNSPTRQTTESLLNYIKAVKEA